MSSACGQKVASGRVVRPFRRLSLSSCSTVTRRSDRAGQRAQNAERRTLRPARRHLARRFLFSRLSRLLSLFLRHRPLHQRLRPHHHRFLHPRRRPRHHHPRPRYRHLPGCHLPCRLPVCRHSRHRRQRPRPRCRRRLASHRATHHRHRRRARRARHGRRAHQRRPHRRRP